MYNIIAEGMTDAERDATLAHLIKIKPGLVVVIDRLSYALAIKQALPNTAVVFRRYHPSNAGGDDNVHMKLSPQQWLESYGDVPKSAGLYLYNSNEPGISPETFAHAEQCARLAVNAGYKICVLNWSVGVPEPSDWERPEALSLLRFAGANRGSVMVGVHEYAPSFSGFEWGLSPDPAHWPDMVGGASWLLSRYRNIFKACDKHGITRPRIGITEASFDGIDAAKDYQNGLPHTNGLIGALWANVEAWNRMKPAHLSWPQYMVEQLHWMYRAIFRTDPEVVGVANFCLGSFEGSRWRLYDLLRVPNIFQLMESKNWKPMTTTIPPTPTVTPNAWVNGTSTVVNVRSSPNGGILRTIDDKGELAKRGGSQPVGDYVWHEYTFLNGVTGWARADVHEAEPLKPSVSLNVPYKKQFGDSTNDDRINDCAAACIAMMMGFAGVDKTVDEVTAAIGAPEGTVHFRYFKPAALTFGFESEVRQGVHLTDIIKSLNEGYPMMVLVNYMHLRGGNTSFNYGHFVVPIGYEFDGKALTLIVHDPYNAASMRFHAGLFAKAIGEMEGTGNTAFQSLFFTGQVTPPPPSGDESPALIRLATIHREIAALNAEAITILSTIKG